MSQADFTILSFTLVLVLFVGMLSFLEVGRHIGRRMIQRHGHGMREGVGEVDAAVYGLLALLIGFSFSGAAARFDHRRELVAQEVNAISTAWDQIEMLPAERRERIRCGMRRWVDALLASYTAPVNTDEALRESPALASAQRELWAHAVAAVTAPGGEQARMLLLPALTDLFGLSESERLARRIHPPLIIFIMIGLAALATALFVGYALASAPRRNWLFSIGVTATIAVTTLVIIELEFPRLGLLHVSSMDVALREARAKLDSPDP